MTMMFPSNVKKGSEPPRPVAELRGSSKSDANLIGFSISEQNGESTPSGKMG